MDTAMPLTPTELVDARDRLLRRAYLYDDPASFRAGVDSALDMIEQRSLRPLRPADPRNRRAS